MAGPEPGRRDPDRHRRNLHSSDGGTIRSDASRGGRLMSGLDDDDRPYDVGYGRPPKATRFRKGQSGNPRGRPKGAQGLRSLLEAALAQQITVSEGGRTT